MAERRNSALLAEKKYRENNREILNAKRREYYKKNRSKCLAYARQYWKDNPSLRLKHEAARQKRIRENPEERKRRNQQARKDIFKLRKEALAQYGGDCQCCHENRNEFLAIDHIYGCTKELRKEQGGGNTFYRWLKRNGFPSGYQVLCHNCNMAKAFHGYCPHQKDEVT